MKKTSFFVLIILTIFFLTGCKRPGDYQIAGENAAFLYGTNTIGQSFVSKADNLFNVKIFAKTGFYQNGYLPNKKDIVFHLRSSPTSQEDIISLPLNAVNVPDDDYLSLQFPPIKDSSNKKYYFFLESKEATAAAAIKFVMSDVDLYSDGTAYIAGVKQTGDFKFKTFYYGDFIQTTEGYFSDFYNRLTSDKMFFIFYASIIITLVLGIIWSKKPHEV